MCAGVVVRKKESQCIKWVTERKRNDNKIMEIMNFLIFFCPDVYEKTAARSKRKKIIKFRKLFVSTLKSNRKKIKLLLPLGKFLRLNIGCMYNGVIYIEGFFSEIKFPFYTPLRLPLCQPVCTINSKYWGNDVF